MLCLSESCKESITLNRLWQRDPWLGSVHLQKDFVLLRVLCRKKAKQACLLWGSGPHPHSAAIPPLKMNRGEWLMVGTRRGGLSGCNWEPEAEDKVGRRV